MYQQNRGSFIIPRGYVLIYCVWFLAGENIIKSLASINEAIIMISVIGNIVRERIKRERKREENKFETHEMVNLG